MQKEIWLLFIVSFVLVATGCKTYEAKIQEQGAKRLTQSDLENIFSKTVEIDFKDGSQVFNADGTTSVTIGSRADDGTYRFIDGRYCSAWKNIRQQEKCWKVYIVSDKELHFVEMNGAFKSVAYIK